MERKKQKRKAFTLVELLVVIIILGLNAGVAAPKLMKSLWKAKVDLARPMMTPIEGAIETFALHCGMYPEDLDSLLIPPAGLEDKWVGPYLKRSQLLDPWKNPYIYVPEGEINLGSYDLISLGADGTDGGEGDGEDIYNE